MKEDWDSHFQQLRDEISGIDPGKGDDTVFIDVDLYTIGKMSKQEYEKASEKMFIHFQKKLNSKPGANAGKKTEMSVASINDFQLFATMERDGSHTLGKDY